MKAIDTRALTGLDVERMVGLEFGPLNRPKVYKDESNIYYLDHCTTEELKRKYPNEDSTLHDEFVAVDFVADGRPLKDIIGDVYPLDYVVASHVIEHTPNLVGWLKDIHDCLKLDGVLALWIPDKRFTSDIFRRITSYEEVKVAHFEGRTRPGLRVVLDDISYSSNVVCYHLWDDYRNIAQASYRHGPEKLTQACTDFSDGKYIDVHNWVFTPWTFFELLGRINNDFDLGFDLKWYQTTPQYDLQFMIQLVKTEASKQTTDWNAAAAQAYLEANWPPHFHEIAWRYIA